MQSYVYEITAYLVFISFPCLDFDTSLSVPCLFVNAEFLQKSFFYFITVRHEASGTDSRLLNRSAAHSYLLQTFKFRGSKHTGNIAPTSISHRFLLFLEVRKSSNVSFAVVLQLSLIAGFAFEESCVASLLIFSMPGVQSFVAQRQQGYQNSSRQTLGAQNRVPIPRTKLENTKGKQSFHEPEATHPASPPVAGNSIHWSKQQTARTSVVQGSFDTDAEGFEDTATMSIGGSSQGYRGEGDDHGPKTDRCVAETANVILSGPQLSFRRGQEQTYHIQDFRQLDAEGSGDEADQRSYPESSDEEEDIEPDEEELMRDGILQDLNSLGFSQYLQGETCNMTQAASQPIMATPMGHSSLASGDVVQRRQKPAHSFKATGNSISSSAADPGRNLQHANHQAHERATNQNLVVPVQKVLSPSMDQLPISAQHRQFPEHYKPSRQPSISSQQTLRPTGVTRDVMATYLQPQASEERPLSAENGPINLNLGADNSPVDWSSDVGSRYDRKPAVSVDGPRTRKRARDLDYSPDQISSMTFEQLSNEPFDLASGTINACITQELSSETLAAKMDHVLAKFKDEDSKLIQRRAFFSSLSIEQYEECANLIIGRFSAIMSKLTEARQQRRRVAKDFEEEVVRREECIGGKATVVSKNLGRLKRGGEEVVRGAAL